MLRHPPGNWAQLLLKMGGQLPFLAANYPVHRQNTQSLNNCYPS